MKPQRWVVLGSGGGLLVGALMFLGHNGARADYEHEVVKLQNNPKIRCLPQANNQVYRQQKLPQEMVSVLKAQGHQGCAACHRSSHPKQGDRPKVNAATAILKNDLDHPVKYDLRVGKGEWQSYELRPKESRPISYKYESKKQKKKHKSPPHFVRFESNGKQQEKQLLMVATPKKNLGNLYYFTENKKDSQVNLKTPKKKIYRKKKR
jgi:hypothetical protein